MLNPILSDEGTLLEALLKWGRARAGRRGNPMVDAAPAAMPRKRGPGGPWVTVRAHYGALPSVAGRDRRRVGESLPGWRACSRLRSEVRSQGRRSRRDGASERRFFTTKARLSALHLPSKRG